MDPEERDGAGGTAGAGVAGPTSEAGDRGVTEVLFAFLESTGGAVSSLADIYGDRLRASTKESLAKLVGAVLVGAATLLWIGSATLASVRGLCGAVGSLARDEAWVGDLAGGLLALALAAAAWSGASWWSRRTQLRALEIKYATPDSTGARADTQAVPRFPTGTPDAAPANGVADPL